LTESARDLVTPLYGWFREGFDTPDMIEAKVLLDTLAPCGRGASEPAR
jgi:hypothetical protein